MELAGSSILAMGVPNGKPSASPPKESEASPSLPSVLELNKLAYFYGREYFVLRSGRAKVIFQVDRADLGPAFSYMLFDSEDASQSASKDGAFNFDPEAGFASSALRVELGGFSYCAFGQETDCHWVNLDGVPAIESVWWAGGVKVTERIIAFVGAEALHRTILLDGAHLAGDDVVTARLFLSARAILWEWASSCPGRQGIRIRTSRAR